MKLRYMRVFAAASLAAGSVSWAQNTADNVHLFQTYFQDAPIVKSVNGEGFFQYGTYSNSSVIDVAVQSAFPVAPKFQLGGALAFENYSPDQGDSQSGITDILVSGRYQVVQGSTPVAVGALFTLPVGSEDLGEGNFNFGFFGSLRHDVTSSPLVLGGTFGLNFVEKAGNYNPTTGQFDTDHGTSVLIAGSLIYPMQSGLSLVFEMNMQPDDNYALLSGGLDYPLSGGGRVRGALGLGLDDAAPDFAFRLGYSLGF